MDTVEMVAWVARLARHQALRTYGLRTKTHPDGAVYPILLVESADCA